MGVIRANRKRDGYRKHLTALRIERGWSQETVAFLSGYSETTIRNWETGDVEPRRQSLIDWRQTLGVGNLEK